MRDEPLPGNTPLDPDEAEGLLHDIGTQGELNELEQENIQMGQEWAVRTAVTGRRRDVMTEPFVYELHRRMFGEVWSWAGQVRRSNKNLGIDWPQIRPAVRDLIEDARLWREDGVFEADELAIRFHHRLVWIHPFPNGNGRHARMMADLIVMRQGRPGFTWGRASLHETSTLRTRYIEALQAADAGNVGPLVEFARS